jgi:hypothetical protein
MPSWGALLGECAQNGCTPLSIACYRGHVVAVELLLAHADVAVNQATKVRGRRRASGERGQEWQAGVHTTMLRRRAAHLTAVRLVCGDPPARTDVGAHGLGGGNACMEGTG